MIDLAKVEGISPVEHFAASMLHDAIHCCHHGDQAACAWLQHHGQHYLQLVSDNEQAAAMLRNLTPTTTQLELDLS